MKTILKFLFLLLLLIGIYILYGTLTAPKQMKAEKTMVVKASPEALYHQVADLKNWPNWSPWEAMDPNMKKEYSANTYGKGAWNSWESEKKSVGNGKMTITDAKDNEYVKTHMDFGDQGTGEADMYFKPVDGGTEVKWTFQSNDETSKFQNFLYGKMIGASYKKGIKRLGEYAAANPDIPESVKAANYHRLGEIEEVDMPTRRFIGYKASTGTKGDELQKAMADGLPKCMAYLTENKINPSSAPATMWLNWDEENNKAEMINGFFVDYDGDVPGDMESETVEGGKYIKLVSYGDYAQEDKAHYAIADYAKEKGYELGMPVSVYTNDPTEVKPEEVETEIWYGVK